MEFKFLIKIIFILNFSFFFFKFENFLKFVTSELRTMISVSKAIIILGVFLHKIRE
jgi:hypothetical protein